jgi:SAM-dependent methyltransferase
MMANKSMWAGDSYDYLMGRWSRLMAPKFAGYAAVKDGDRVLDVGCGTGSLTRALLDVGPNVKVTAVDGSEDFIEIGRHNVADDRATFRQGDAQSLQYPTDTFDNCVSLLVMNFIPDAKSAVSEMRRVTRAGGTLAAAVWDYGDGMEMLRHLWDEAASIDETAGAKHEGNMPLCREGELATLWSDGGLTNVDEDGLVIQMDFASFDDYWSPFLTGIGPSGSYVSNLDASTQTALKDRLRGKLTQGRDDESFSMTARVWAVRGTVEG